MAESLLLTVPSLPVSINGTELCSLAESLLLTVPSLPADMANIVLLLVIIMLVFSVIGVTLFRDAVPTYFGGLSSGILHMTCCNRG